MSGATRSRRGLIALAALGSLTLLVAVHALEALGWQPCAMCLWQRWPHRAAVALGLIGLAAPLAALAWAGGAAAAGTALIGLYHSGVERHWWPGPSSCTSAGGGLGGLSGADLLATDGPALVLCDQFTPFLLGLSMANWNVLASALLALLWIAAARTKRRPRSRPEI